jgi:hypothetical protein
MAIATLACDESIEKFKAYSQRGKANMKAYWATFVDMDISEEGYEPDNDFRAMGPGVGLLRKKAIEFAFVHIYQSPPQEKWSKLKLIPSICRILQISCNSHSFISRVLREIVTSRAEKGFYDARASLTRRGRPRLIQEKDECAEIVYHAMGSGQSLQSTTVMVNKFREAQNMIPRNISWYAVQHFVKTSKIINTYRRQRKKSGKDDEGTVWAIARKAQCNMMLKQLEIGDRIKAGDVGDAQAMMTETGLSPLMLEACTFFDEKHSKVKLGHTSKHEAVICRNAEGEACTEKDGGKFGPRKPNTSMKYSGEARGLFGAYMKRVDGEMTGVRLRPFSYTNRKILSIKDYKAV